MTSFQTAVTVLGALLVAVMIVWTFLRIRSAYSRYALSLGAYSKYALSLRFRACAPICVAPLGLARRCGE